MTQDQVNDNPAFDSLPFAILLGIIGSVGLFVLIFLMIWFWHATYMLIGIYVVYNWPVLDTLNYDGFLVFLTFSILIGMCTYYYFNQRTKNLKNYLLVAGICGFVFGTVFEILLFLADYPVYFYFPILNFGHSFLFIFITTGLVVMTGVVIWEIGSKEREKSVSFLINIRRSILIMIIIIALVVLIPLGYAQMMKGYPDGEEVYCGAVNLHPSVQILNDTAKRIVVYGSDRKCVNDESPLYITFNGLDISNQTAIEKSGLSLFISPEEGLTAKNGSQVIISGSDMHQEACISVEVIIKSGYRYDLFTCTPPLTKT